VHQFGKKKKEEKPKNFSLFFREPLSTYQFLVLPPNLAQLLLACKKPPAVLYPLQSRLGRMHDLDQY
jgi:hypothetical protein